jgi:hypothetical protein
MHEKLERKLQTLLDSAPLDSSKNDTLAGSAGTQQQAGNGRRRLPQRQIAEAADATPRRRGRLSNAFHATCAQDWTAAPSTACAQSRKRKRGDCEPTATWRTIQQEGVDTRPGADRRQRYATAKSKEKQLVKRQGAGTTKAEAGARYTTAGVQAEVGVAVGK